mgnify:FL=1
MTDNVCCIDGHMEACGTWPDGLYVYQNIRTAGHEPLYLDRHIACLRHAAREVTGRAPEIDTAGTARDIAELLRRNNYPTAVQSQVIMRWYASGHLLLAGGEISPYREFGLRSIYPTAAVVTYDNPLSPHPTSAREALAAIARLRAASAGARIAIQADSAGLVVSADNAPVFTVREYTVTTPPAADSVERSLVIEAVRKAGLQMATADIAVADLDRADEIFFIDYRGITSIGRCGSRAYMHILTERIAENIR